MGSILRVVTVTGFWAFAVYSVYTYLGTGLRTHGFTTGSIAAALILYGIGAFLELSSLSSFALPPTLAL